MNIGRDGALAEAAEIKNYFATFGNHLPPELEAQRQGAGGARGQGTAGLEHGRVGRNRSPVRAGPRAGPFICETALTRG